MGELPRKDRIGLEFLRLDHPDDRQLLIEDPAEVFLREAHLLSRLSYLHVVVRIYLVLWLRDGRCRRRPVAGLDRTDVRLPYDGPAYRPSELGAAAADHHDCPVNLDLVGCSPHRTAAYLAGCFHKNRRFEITST